MIYQECPLDAPIDQGDIIDACPILYAKQLRSDPESAIDTAYVTSRGIVLTQTCDLAQQKVNHILVAVVLDAQDLVNKSLLKAAEVRGPIRAGRVYGWYYLPSDPELALPEMVIDLHQLHTIRADLLASLCRLGKRRARLQTPYREHLAKHFADTYSRIGLPVSYVTE